MSTSAALTANLLLSINRLAGTFPIANEQQALKLENEALHIFMSQLQMSAKTLGDTAGALGTLITRKQRTIHFNADEQYRKINGAVTLTSLLVYQTSVILQANPEPSSHDRANILAGVTALQTISHELSDQIHQLHKQVIAVI